jgi:hypothetical protein
MVVDCDSCEVRGKACQECVISVLLGPPNLERATVQLDASEQRALDVLAGAGMVPKLRLIPISRMNTPEVA